MKIIKIIYIIIGSISLAFGFIGIFLPLIPTTPFLLLSAFLFAKSSDKMYQWLMHHKRFGPYLKQYLIEKSMTKKGKVKTILLLWFTISISIYLAPIPMIRIMLTVIASLVSIHIASLNSI